MMGWYGMGMGWAAWLGMGLFWLALLGVIVYLVVRLLPSRGRRGAATRRSHPRRSSTAGSPAGR
jgi:putative membrane protein